MRACVRVYVSVCVSVCVCVCLSQSVSLSVCVCVVTPVALYCLNMDISYPDSLLLLLCFITSSETVVLSEKPFIDIAQ